MIASISKISEAINFIPADLPREDWVRIGMAVKSELGDDGFELWDTWSQQADSYKTSSAKATWKSIKSSGGIRIGTLFREASANGWRDTGVHVTPTPEELGERKRRQIEREAKNKQDERRKIAGYARAAASAEIAIKRCKPAEHNYLRSKKLPNAVGLVNEERELLVPMRSVDTNHLVGVQVIRWLMDVRQWEKKMSPGMRAKGAIFRLGSDRSGETWLVEGYATGLSVEAALRRMSSSACVVVCFSDRNLVHVAPLLSGRKFVFADHDVKGAGQRAANDTGLPFCMSPVPGEDANDLHARAGLAALSKLIMETRKR